MMSSAIIENADRRSYVLSAYHSHTRNYTEIVVVSVKVRLHTVSSSVRSIPPATQGVASMVNALTHFRVIYRTAETIHSRSTIKGIGENEW